MQASNWYPSVLSCRVTRSPDQRPLGTHYSGLRSFAPRTCSDPAVSKGDFHGWFLQGRAVQSECLSVLSPESRSNCSVGLRLVWFGFNCVANSMLSYQLFYINLLLARSFQFQVRSALFLWSSWKHSPEVALAITKSKNKRDLLSLAFTTYLLETAKAH